MGQHAITKILLVTICSLYLAGCNQLATMGSKFCLVRGHEHDGVETATEKSMALHRCGNEKSCRYVARLKQVKRFVMVNELNELKGVAVDALWKKEQPALGNIAVHKATDSSASYDSMPSSKAVDGYKGKSYFHGDCFCVQSGVVNPWWRVDLGSSAIINSVSITNTNEIFFNGTLANFDIRIGFIDKNGANQICRENISISKEITVNFLCKNEMIGRYVFVEKHQENMILCEVEVYGILI